MSLVKAYLYVSVFCFVVVVVVLFFVTFCKGRMMDLTVIPDQCLFIYFELISDDQMNQIKNGLLKRLLSNISFNRYVVFDRSPRQWLSYFINKTMTFAWKRMIHTLQFLV